MIKYLNNFISYSYESNVPQRKLLIKNDITPWFNTEILTEMKKQENTYTRKLWQNINKLRLAPSTKLSNNECTPNLNDLNNYFCSSQAEIPPLALTLYSNYSIYSNFLFKCVSKSEV